MIRPYYLLFFIVGVACHNTQDANLDAKRVENLTLLNATSSFDFDITLNDDEVLLNQSLSEIRERSLTYLDENKIPFYNQPFHNVKHIIENNLLFSIFKKMPKGGLLHVHNCGMTDAHWIIAKAKTMEVCYVFLQKDNDEYIYGQLAVFKKESVPKGFVQLQEKLNQDVNFEQELYELLILKRESLSDSMDYWVEFEKRFQRIIQLVSYRPFFLEYYKKAFIDLISDNVQHVEIRYIFNQLYDLEGHTYPFETTVEDFIAIVTEIQKSEPQFTLNLIYTSFKFLDAEAIKNQIQMAFDLKKKFPAMISGFDLVAEEDKGHTIAYYQQAWDFLDSLELVYGLELPLILHAGESNSIENKNLFDVIPLDNKRIGHGFNLVFFSDLMQRVKKQDILIEISPWSNQILGYVGDLRNHPGRILLKNGVQCAISSDDPGVFGYEGLSYDFWIIFFAWELDLKAIKKLVFNSITYSVLQEDTKIVAHAHLEKKWTEFVAKTNKLISKKGL